MATALLLFTALKHVLHTTNSALCVVNHTLCTGMLYAQVLPTLHVTKAVVHTKASQR
jgi:hypothetical protein